MESFTQKVEKAPLTPPMGSAPTSTTSGGKGFKKLIADVMSKVENEKKEISEKLSALKAPKFSLHDKDKQ